MYLFPHLAKNATEEDVVDYYYRDIYHCIGSSVYDSSNVLQQ